jgi:MFS-type transporter involved in bile tolerance (Atg22 family)
LGDVAAGRELSTAFGLYNTVCVLGAVVGPAVTGWARDVTGSFAAGSYVCAAVALGGAGLLRFTRRGP